MDKPLLDSESLADSLAARVHADIIAEGLREGEFFMTAEQLADRYAVSRSVAREAICQLTALGVLTSRQRKGILVARPDPVELTARLLPLYCRDSGEAGLRSLAQFRFALELGAVDLAVAHATPDQLDRFEALAHEFDAVASAQGHSSNADDVDMRLHATLLEMTANPLIHGMHRVVAEYFRVSTQFPSPEDATKAIREHYMILETLRQRDVESVRTLLRLHLQNTIASNPNGSLHTDG